MNWFKKRNNQIIVAVAVLVLLVGGYFVFGRSKAKPQEVTQDQTVQTISAKEIGLELEKKPLVNEVRFVINKASDIKSLDYELTYEADSTAQEITEGGELRIERGVSGSEDLNGKEKYESEWLVLGSESAGTKRYDKGVNSVSLSLRIVKKDGKIYSAEKTLEL